VTARKFFYVCVGLFLLALSYHLGASTATAQAPGNPVVATFGIDIAVVTANGDVYYNVNNNPVTPQWARSGNVFGGPTPTSQESWGQLKSRYAPKSAPTSQTPTDR
jgi:hypothetical protein